MRAGMGAAHRVGPLPYSWVLTFTTRSGVLLTSATMQTRTGSRTVIGRYMT